MASLTYRLPAELKKKLNDTRTAAVQPPADGFMHRGKLNIGPAILLAMSLSAVCWVVIVSLGVKLVH